MKFLSVTLAILLTVLALAGCADSDAPTDAPTDASTTSPTEPSVDTMQMTIAPLLPSGIPIEPGRFYAYDEDGYFYRVLWAQTEDLSPESQVQVEYHSLTELEYPDGYPDGGYTPQYEITATAVSVQERAPSTDEDPIRNAADDMLQRRCDVTDLSGFVISTVTDDNGKHFVEYGLPGGFYLVAVSADGQAEYVFDSVDEYAAYLPLATPQSIRQADQLLSTQLAQYEDTPGYHFHIDSEGHLCLRAEVIVQLELVPTVDENGYIMSGCGFDHDHLFFTQRICPRP